MNEKLNIYLKTNLNKNHFFGKFKSLLKSSNNEKMWFFEEAPKKKESINIFIDDNKDENKFQKLLFNHIDKRGLKDSDVYNKVNIDRRLFSKIRSEDNYHPSKETIILLGLSLELNEEEIVELLASSSYSLPKNNYYDLIIRFCFIEGIYSVMKVNELLESYNCKLLN